MADETVKIKVTSMEGRRGINLRNNSDRTLELDVKDYVGAPPIMVPPTISVSLENRFKSTGLPKDAELKEVPPEIADELKRLEESGGTVVMFMGWVTKSGDVMFYNHSLPGEVTLSLKDYPPQTLAPGRVTKFFREVRS